MTKRKLVVVGNGMAGARAVEDVLARGGGGTFDIAMFGDEPYGNYNRIMLSGILGGSKTLDDILLNAPEWYAEAASNCTAAAASSRSTARPAPCGPPRASSRPTTSC